MIVSFYAVNSFAEPIDLVLQSLEKVNILFYSKIFAVYNLVGDLLVVKPYGIIGVALITSSAVLFKNLFCLYFAKQYTGLLVPKVGLFRLVINSILMGLVLHLMRPYIDGLFSFVMVVVIGLVVYFMLCCLNKAFTKEERCLINDMLPIKLFLF